MEIKKSDERKFYKKTKLLNILDNFGAMDADVVEVNYADGEYSTPNSAYNSLKWSVNRFGKSSVMDVRMRGGVIYLVKKAKVEA